MWTYQKPVEKLWYINGHLQHYWGKREGWRNPVIGICEVTPLGWILFDTWERKTENMDQYWVALIEGGSLIQVYRIDFEEWNAFPGMLPAWWIPF